MSHSPHRFAEVARNLGLPYEQVRYAIRTGRSASPLVCETLNRAGISCAPVRQNTLTRIREQFTSKVTLSDIAKKLAASRIAKVVLRTAQRAEVRCVRLQIVDGIERIAVQRHHAAFLPVLPGTVGIYDYRSTAKAIQSDILDHFAAGGA